MAEIISPLGIRRRGAVSGGCGMKSVEIERAFDNSEQQQVR
jgi:hypothetical protein